MDWQNQADSRIEVKADEDEEIDVVGDTPDPLADYGKKHHLHFEIIWIINAESCFRRDWYQSRCWHGYTDKSLATLKPASKPDSNSTAIATAATADGDPATNQLT